MDAAFAGMTSVFPCSSGCIRVSPHRCTAGHDRVPARHRDRAFRRGARQRHLAARPGRQRPRLRGPGAGAGAGGTGCALRAAPCAGTAGDHQPGLCDARLVRRGGPGPHGAPGRGGHAPLGGLAADLVEREIARGVPAERIVLAGFSQGGAVALHTALRYPRRLAGVLALSTYLPLADTVADEMAAVQQGLPVFLGHGDRDEVIPLMVGPAPGRSWSPGLRGGMARLRHGPFRVPRGGGGHPRLADAPAGMIYINVGAGSPRVACAQRWSPRWVGAAFWPWRCGARGRSYRVRNGQGGAARPPRRSGLRPRTSRLAPLLPGPLSICWSCLETHFCYCLPPCCRWPPPRRNPTAAASTPATARPATASRAPAAWACPCPCPPSWPAPRMPTWKRPSATAAPAG
jgi:pimeloyl-ACP methyl ester carboxylesterase